MIAVSKPPSSVIFDRCYEFEFCEVCSGCAFTTISIYFNSRKCSQMTMLNLKKVTKIMSGLYRNHMYIFKPCEQHISEKKIFEYYGYIHVHWPGVGADQPLLSIFSESLVHLPISCKFSLQMTF